MAEDKKEIVTNLINADFTFVNKVFILKQFSKVITQQINADKISIEEKCLPKPMT